MDKGKFSPIDLVRYIVIFAFSLGILWGGYRGMNYLASLRQKAPRNLEKKIPTVNCYTITRQDFHVYVRGFGLVRSKRFVELASQVQGKVVTVNPKLRSGNSVSKGEELFTIEDTDYVLAVEKLGAEQQRVQATITNLKQEQVNIQQRIDVLSQSRLLAQNKMERSFRLKDQGVTSQQLWEQDRQAFLALEESAVELQNALRLLPARLQEAQAQLKSISIQKQQAQVQLQRTIIKAPFAASIRTSNIEEGMWTAIGVPLAIIDDVSKLEIHVMLTKDDVFYMGLKQQDVNAIHAGELHIPATIETAIGNKKFHWIGKVVGVQPMNMTTRTIPIVVEVDPLDPQQPKNNPPLFVGLLCEVSIQGQLLSQAISLPRAAIRRDNTVYIMKNSSLEIRNVELGYPIGDSIVVQDGLNAGDLVILSNIAFPVENMELKLNENNN